MQFLALFALTAARGLLALPAPNVSPKPVCLIRPHPTAEIAKQASMAPSTYQDAAKVQQVYNSGAILPMNAQYATSGPSPIRFNRRSSQ